MATRGRLRLMVASTVYGFEDQLNQICATLDGFGYEVWNSHRGTIAANPKKSNLENCVAAARDCDVFLGIVRTSYGSGIVGPRSITHEEFREAIRCRKPRWFLVDRDVTIARQILKPYAYKRDGTRTRFKLKRNSVIDDVRVIDLYHDAIQHDVPVEKRTGHWVQEYTGMTDVLRYLEHQFKDEPFVRQICTEMTNP